LLRQKGLENFFKFPSHFDFPDGKLKKYARKPTGTPATSNSRRPNPKPFAHVRKRLRIAGFLNAGLCPACTRYFYGNLSLYFQFLLRKKILEFPDCHPGKGLFIFV
jgi:hypothetical protein